jgi:hypothetical protein
MPPDDPEIDAEVVGYIRDDKIDDARTSILDFFTQNHEEVFYERQLTVIFEKTYFHWITVKALLELAAGGSINSQMLELVPGVPIRFFWARGNRYWRRQAGRVTNLVRRFSENPFIHAIGLQGELLVDASQGAGPPLGAGPLFPSNRAALEFRKSKSPPWSLRRTEGQGRGTRSDRVWFVNFRTKSQSVGAPSLSLRGLAETGRGF